MDEDSGKDKTENKNLELRELCRVQGLAEAEVIKSFLGSNGISSLLRGQILQSIYPITVDGLGEIKILVLEKDYPLAKELLENMP